MDARHVTGYRNIFQEIPYCTRYMVFEKGERKSIEKGLREWSRGHGESWRCSEELTRCAK